MVSYSLTLDPSPSYDPHLPVPESQNQIIAI